MTKYFLIAGEASGDKHAASLIRAIAARDPEACFAGLGGDKMAEVGCHLYQDYRQMAFMGFVAVLRNMRQVRANFQIAQQALLQERPEVLILIDYPSFNLRMARFCRKHLPQTKIYYYIPPKVWAWKRRRVHQIARLCDEVLGIFPFEPAFYAQYGYECKYVGNPTAEEILKVRGRIASGSGKQLEEKRIAILPGSRMSEISHCLPRMLEAARRFSDCEITVCAAPGIADDFYAPYLQGDERLTRDTYGAIAQAEAAIVNSGTATLETALIGCPQVAVYHVAGSRLIGLIRWAQPLFFSVPYFTLVNILGGKEVIKECIANEFTTDKVAKELGRLMNDEAYKNDMLVSYEHIRSVLGSLPASETAAERIVTSKNRS